MRKGCMPCKFFETAKIFMLNFLVGRFYDNFTDIALYCSLELRTDKV